MLRVPDGKYPNEQARSRSIKSLAYMRFAESCTLKKSEDFANSPTA